ncbi:MAG: helix-turn-helix transcriptional regulator [Actinomycetota bacterium]|nr:helix-turn-helix transcriptional regulator [Actinomycetota bacterium]
MAIEGVDLAVFEREDMRQALACRDITTVYRILVNYGVAQRYLAELVGQTQSEVSEILHGRKVQSYAVLVRIAQGLGVSRGSMGLAYLDERDEYEGPEPLFEEVTEDMKRRALLAAGAVALCGSPVLGEILELPERPPTPTPLPNRLGLSDLQALQGLTRALETEARYHGGGYDVISPVAQRAERLLVVPAAEPTKAGIATAVADLHNVAGWAAFDSHQDDTARYHFARAMSLGNAGDGFQFAKAAYLAGVSTAERGHLNDGLKLMQLGQIRINQGPEGPRTGELKAWLAADTACVLAHMGHPDPARSALSSAREGWRAPDADDQADMDWVTALVEMHLGRHDVAEQLVSTSVRHWEGTSDRRQAVLGRITLAQLHVQAGDSRGNDMAYQVLKDVRELRSVRARERLRPMIDTLEARPESESRQLAGMARRVASI